MGETASAMKGARVVVSSGKRRARPVMKQAVDMTDTALKRLQGMLKNVPEDRLAAFKLGVKSRGCNGLAYTLDYAKPDEIDPSKRQEIVEKENVKILVEPSALMYVVGTTMDFVEDPLRSEFVFENPNATGTCGCGESFNVKT